MGQMRGCIPPCEAGCGGQMWQKGGVNPALPVCGV